ncbi:MAG: histidine--tRNA ligase [Sphingobacteriales bacterium]|nr:histidine--tRNA ligase [Sphingobacteriales bacterium]
MSKPGIPQGTRDFSAETVKKRNHILSTIRRNFELYGFQPLETPAMENLETLMGKYGEEGDKLIFKILNNGLYETKNQDKAREGFEKALTGKNSPLLTERALKYDLTIPFARYVAMNHGQLTFPYKRYQIQPVWRADRPQKGRYREFTQCDADIVGSASLFNEAELAALYHDVFTQLGLKGYKLMVNSRKLLSALAEACGNKELLTGITVAIDKLDKIGLEKVKEALKELTLTEPQVQLIENYLNIDGSNDEKLESIARLFPESAEAREGLTEIKTLLQLTIGLPIILDLTLARGLNYYTGIIFEVKAPETVQMGSIGGGGRYDDLTGLFGVQGIPGVGISFGVDRIYDVMEALQLFPDHLQTATTALFLHMGNEESRFVFPWVQVLRHQQIACELYPETAKMDKQLKYADKKRIPFAVIMGSREMANETCIVKNLQTGDQVNIPLNELTTYFLRENSRLPN